MTVSDRPAPLLLLALAACGGGERRQQRPAPPPRPSPRSQAPAGRQLDRDGRARPPRAAIAWAIPNAPIKLVEYGSRAVPDLRRVRRDGHAAAARNLCRERQGELRIPRLPASTARSTCAAALLGQCGGPSAVLPDARADVRRTSSAFLDKLQAMPAAMQQQLQAMPPAQARQRAGRALGYDRLRQAARRARSEGARMPGRQGRDRRARQADRECDARQAASPARRPS